jgi:hypothetical protein
MGGVINMKIINIYIYIYNMVLVSHKYKFIYIKNVKVAGSSVESFFGKFCINPENIYNYEDTIEQSISDYGIIGSRSKGIKKDDIWKNHINSEIIRSQLGNDKFNEYFKFAIIRNPYDVLVSYYYFENSKLEFKKYAKIKIVDNLSRCCINGENVCDYYIRFENLIEDIIEVCKILKIDYYDVNNLPNHKSNIRPKINYRDFYDEETRMIVYKNHKKIFEKFGYEF